MFVLPKFSSQPKYYATHGIFPLDLRVQNPPRSKKPFSNILANPWYHTVDLTLPKELVSVIYERIEQESHALDYSRLHMKLEELIEGDFFNVCIKTGNIEMLSQGSPTFETQYSLREGILRLDLPKDTFQRLGLEGKPIPSGGRKHVPTRIRIEINLRLPSMVTGQKYFERIRWALKNVLNESVTWLFRDCTHLSKQTTNNQPSGPITKFHPLPRSANPPTRTDQSDILVPNLSAPPRNSEESSAYLRSDTSEDILEWLSLITLQSPRLKSTDNIDSYLSRYVIPTSVSSTAIAITTLRWHGFIPASWICKIVGLCASIFQAHGQAWYTITAVAIRTEQGWQRGEGCCLFFPLPHTTAVDNKDDGSGMVLDSDEQQENNNTELAGHTTIQGQRDFIIWDFVDCITQR